MFKEIDNEELEVMLENNEVAFDVRREEEFIATGIIKNSIPLTFFDDTGAYDIDKWMQVLQNHVKNKEQVIILICAHANRTKTIGNFLSEQMGYSNVYDLKGGISSWMSQGLQTVKYK